jgi:hypothetical protein
LDLGHQLAVLWEMTDDQERAKKILQVRKTASFVEFFLYVCPEPVLAK